MPPPDPVMPFFLTLAFGSQKGWKITSFDAQSAYLQPEGITRLLLIRMPWQSLPPGTQPGQVLVATGSIYGTCDAGRGWYLHSKEVFKREGCLESGSKRGFIFFLPQAVRRTPVSLRTPSSELFTHT